MFLQDGFKQYRDFVSESLKNSFINFSDFPWIPVLFTIGLVLRVTGFRTVPIWYDEMFSLQITRQGLLEMIQSLKMNISPPGLEISLWFLTRIFGWNDFSLRILSILAGMATLVVVYRNSLILKFTREQQIASLALVAFLPYQVLVAQQGRVYAIFALLYLTGIYGAISGRLIWLGISISGMLWSHNISFLFIPGLILISLNTNHRNWKKIFFTVGLAFATYLPWAQETIRQAALPTPWFKPITATSFFLQLYESFFAWGLPDGSNIIAFYWLIGVILIALVISFIVWAAKSLQALTQRVSGFFKKDFEIRRNYISARNLFQHSRYAQQTLLIAFGFPFLLLLATSIFVRNIFLSRTLYPLAVPLVMWIALFYGKPSSNKTHALTWLISALILAGGLPYWTPSQIGQRGIPELQSVISPTYTASPQKQLRKGVIFYHSTGLSVLLFKYYFPEYENYLIDGDNVLGSIDLQVTKTHIQRIAPEQLPDQKIWVVWTRHPDLKIFNGAADKRFRDLVYKYDCPLVNVIPYPNSWDLYIYLCDLGDK